MPQRFSAQTIIGGRLPVKCVRCQITLVEPMQVRASSTPMNIPSFSPPPNEQPVSDLHATGLYLGVCTNAVLCLCQECIRDLRAAQSDALSHSPVSDTNPWFCQCYTCFRYFEANLCEVASSAETERQNARVWRGRAHKAICAECSSMSGRHTFLCTVCDAHTVGCPAFVLRSAVNSWDVCWECLDYTNRHTPPASCVECGNEHWIFDPDRYPDCCYPNNTWDEEAEMCALGFGCRISGAAETMVQSNRSYEQVCLLERVQEAIETPPDWHIVEGCNCTFCVPTPPQTDAVETPRGAYYNWMIRTQGAAETQTTAQTQTGHTVCALPGCRRPVTSGDGANVGYCDRCLERLAPPCVGCQTRTMDAIGITVTDGRVVVCRKCYTSMTKAGKIVSCTIQCGNAMLADDPVCSCGGMYRYNYKPPFFEFYVAKGQTKRQTYPYIGVEIEMEAKKASLRNRASTLVRESKLPLYCQFDGSLDRDLGMEIVSHPFTYDWLNENWSAWAVLLRKLRKLGFRAWDTETCGMHVHISKRAMCNADGSANDNHRMLFCHMIYEYPGLAIAIAGRGRDSGYLEAYASLDKEPKSRLLEKVQQNNNLGHGHRVAVNVEHPESMEVRIFRGTLNAASFRKNIEYVHSLWAFTKRVDIEKANEYNYLQWLFGKNPDTYPGLVEYLKDRYVS